jgi:hypothetical protein
MKKLLWGSMILILAACGDKDKEKNQAALLAPKPGILTKGSTLDGLPFAQAHDWVTNFRTDSTNNVDVTSIWFSRYWVKETIKLLISEKNIGVDGFRIYFAKNDAGQNTLVILATKDEGIDPLHPEVHKHSDFFDHKTATFIRSNGNNADISDEYSTNEGTRLYTLKPPFPKSCIPTERNHVLAYDASVRYANQFDKGPMNTHSEWYPTGMLYDIDKELDALAAIAAADPTGKKLAPDGIRIYLCKDDKKENLLVFVTTQKYKNSNGTVFHMDNFECYTPNTTTQPAVPYNKGGFDRGEKCPNYCDGVDLPCDSCSVDKKLVNKKTAASTKN